MENKKVILSDFDGTITLKDSYFRSVFYFPFKWKIILLSPVMGFYILLYFLKIINRNKAKELGYKLFFRGITKKRIESKMPEFIKKTEFNTKTLDIINDYRKKNYDLYLVSASPDFYIPYFAENLGADGHICTEVEWNKGKLTGNLKEPNCNYKRKVVKIENANIPARYSEIVSFGNSDGDRAMFEISDIYYFVDGDKITKHGNNHD